MDDELDRTLDAVGPRLKRLRLRRDITLADLAEETGISASTLSRLEAGLRRPTLEQLLPLARAYGPVEYLSLIGKQGERAHLRVAPKPRDPS